jgi:hypothetical protein
MENYEYVSIDCVDLSGRKMNEGISGEFLYIEVRQRSLGVLPICGL